MPEEKYLPLDFAIPFYPVEALRDMANTARWELRHRKRTNSQIECVQNLIYELIEIYFNEEQEKEIQQLEIEARVRLKYCGDGDDLYPFAVEHNRYGDSLVFVGDKDKLNVPCYKSMDESDALYDIIEWFKDNETEEGFVDAEPCEYFYALSLSLIADAVIFIRSLENNQDNLGTVKISLGGLHPITRAAMKAMKAIEYGNERKTEAFYEEKLSYLNDQIEVLTKQIATQVSNSSVEENRKKATIKKATDSRHKKNREAKNIVCENW
ncbi:hypothetical protein [Serratia liquefaciens]|uniref:hypothetical protein n=2 Tax=Serratia TaxID=613 RepID=UPI00101F2E43|nr:hypothetical protein [Serratia liquefaciens]RYM76462.1 hypothetical protein BSR00_07165 [Serratia liquefaciens]RYM80832.1 hypothetical protein BSR01_06865 [Serratia liquefaciens]